MSTPDSFRLKAGDFEFDLTTTELSEIRFLRTTPHDFHLLESSVAHQVRILEADIPSKTFKVESGGEVFSVSLRDAFDLTIEKMGFNASAGKQLRFIKAPMPGLVLDVFVSDGQEVHKEDKLLILEAMKMENSIKIPADALIRKVHVKPGQVVEKGQTLIELG